jgi:DNA-binding NarL/FixJ family response regulator
MLGLELMTFLDPRLDGGRRALVHILRLAPPGIRSPRGAKPEQIQETVGRLRALSRREMEVLRLLAAGLQTQTIAAELCISRTTVCNHIESILRKLCVHRRLDAILAFLQRDG